MLANGRTTAEDWDRDCRNWLTNANGNSPRPAGTTLRGVINGDNNPGAGDASYREMSWLSRRNFPSDLSPIYVFRGETFVEFQINTVTFLCGTLVNDERYSGATTNVPVSPAAGIVAGDFDRWAQRTTGKIDRIPNPRGSINMKPARLGNRTNIDGVTILNPDATGSLNNVVGQNVNVDRQDDTRFWFGNKIDMTYTVPGGLQNDPPVQRGNPVRFELAYRNIDKYIGPVFLCYNNGNSISKPNANDFGGCGQRTPVFSVQIILMEDWSVSATTGLNETTPFPTQTITFNHNVNVAGRSLSRDINWSTWRSIGGAPYVQQNGGNLGNRYAGSYNVANNNYYVPPGTPPGTQICEFVAYSPTAWNNGSQNQSATQCATVTYYDLYPTSALPLSTAEEGQIVDLRNAFYVNNTGNESSPVGTDWRIKQVVIQPGNPYTPPGAATDNMSCGAVVRAGVTCADYKVTGPGSFFNPGNTPLGSYLGPEADYQVPFGTPVGTRICFLTAVDPVTSWGVRNRWSGSNSACLVVSKSPYLTIINGDGWAGGNFASVDPTCAIGASPSGYSTRARAYQEGTFGSFGEYAVFSLGSISSFGSGGKPGQGTSSPTLAFKRPGGGFFTSTTPGVNSLTSHCLQDANDYYNITAAAPSYPGNVLAGRFGNWYYNGDLTLGAGPDLNLAANQRTAIYVNGNLNLNSNIIFNNVPNLSSLQSVAFIVSGDINVDGNVSRLDGYYQAKGKFRTCRNAPDNGVNIGACNSTLTINGALNVGRLVAKRTFGNTPGADRNSPAETIIMRPDIFLSGYGQASSGIQLQTVNETELPPRY